MPSCSRLRNRAATLPEVLIAVAIMFVVLVMALEFCTTIERAWKTAGNDPFADAENAFETVVKGLASATLEPYQDYADTAGNFRTNGPFVPDHLARRSDLDFVCGPAPAPNGLLAADTHPTAGSAVFFLAPQGSTQVYVNSGMNRLLNAVGYFVEFGNDDSAPSFIGTSYYRWRLKEIVQPAESVQIYATTNAAAFVSKTMPSTPIPVLADNIIAFVVLPERAANDTGNALAPAFNYDSRDTGNRLTLHQLPARLFVAMVAIDEAAAAKLAGANGPNPPQVSVDFFQHGNQPDAAQQKTQLLADLANLDSTLTVQKINHRIFQRDILLSSANWSDTASK